MELELFKKGQLQADDDDDELEDPNAVPTVASDVPDSGNQSNELLSVKSHPFAKQLSGLTKHINIFWVLKHFSHLVD